MDLGCNSCVNIGSSTFVNKHAHLVVGDVANVGEAMHVQEQEANGNLCTFHSIWL